MTLKTRLDRIDRARSLRVILVINGNACMYPDEIVPVQRDDEDRRAFIDRLAQAEAAAGRIHNGYVTVSLPHAPRERALP